MKWAANATAFGIRTALFLADDMEGGGGDFAAYSDLIADGYVDEPANTVKLIPETYQVQKQYLGLTCDTAGNPADAAQCRGNLVNTLNTTGALFVSYVGHSTKEYWAVGAYVRQNGQRRLDKRSVFAGYAPDDLLRGIIS